MLRLRPLTAPNGGAEALARYRTGERANLPRELHAKAEARAEEHRETDSLEGELVLAAVDFPEDATLNEIHEAVYGSGSKPPDKAMQMRLSAALKNLGFRAVRKSRHGARQMVWSHA